MKKYMKRIVIVLFLLGTIITTFCLNLNKSNNLNSVEKVINIEEVLKTEAYSYLPESAKEYIRTVYEKDGVILLTEKNKQTNEEYLNPAYIEYLKSKEKYSVIPSETIVDFVYNEATAKADLPEQYNLRDVDGKNFVTPYKNQGSEGLCWDFATNAHIESYLLKTNNKEYDSSATILSEQQLDYATATDGVEVDGKIYNNRRELSSGGNFEIAEDVLLDGLAVVPNSWDQDHKTEIANKTPIERADIYNLNNSLYELNTSYHFPSLDFKSATEDEKISYINAIKENIMNYGGAWVSTDVYGANYNKYDEKWIKVVDVQKNNTPFMHGFHALEIIGWDDNIEYTICKKSFNSQAPNDCGTGGYFTGKGVWILKNSWGDKTEPVVYLAYESFDTDIHFVVNLDERSWSNFYKANKISSSDSTKTATFKVNDNTLVDGEKLNKIKLNLSQNANVKISISNNNGSSYTSLGEITAPYKGYYSLDVSSKKITFTKNSIIKVVSNDKVSIITDVRLYTTRSATTKKILTQDIIYDSSNEHLNSSDKFVYYLYSQTKNISNGTILTIRIKDENDNYISSDGYTFEYGKVYANMNYGRLTIDSDYFKNGNYTIEMSYDGNTYTSSAFIIDVDLLITNGDGSKDKPYEME